MTLKEQYEEFEKEYIEQIRQDVLKTHGEILKFEFDNGVTTINTKKARIVRLGENPKAIFCAKNNCALKDIE